MVEKTAPVTEAPQKNDASLFEFQWRMAQYTSPEHPLFLHLSDQEAVDQFRSLNKNKGIKYIPGTPEYEKAFNEERETPKHSVLIVGLGKGGDAAKSRIASVTKVSVHSVLAEKMQINGGRAGFTIDHIAHDDRQKNAFEKGAIAFADPAVDTLYGVEIPHEQVQEFAKQMGCVAVVWVGGGEENEIPSVDYQVDGVYRGMDFIDIINMPLSEGSASMRDLAHSIGYDIDPKTGVPLPTVIQGGGRVGEDVIIKDVAMRIALGLERKAFALFGAAGNEVELRQALASIDAIDWSRLFKDGSLEEHLTSLGLTKQDIGSTVLQYHDNQELMKLQVVKPEDIDAEVQRRVKYNSELPQETTVPADLLPEDRKSAEKYLRSKPALTQKVNDELTKWKQKFGIKIIDRRTISSVHRNASGRLKMQSVETVGAKKTHDWQIGLLVTAIGFHGIDQIKKGDIPIFYGGMAATGEGALAATIKNINSLIDGYVIPYIEKLPPPTMEVYAQVQDAVMHMRESSALAITDPVERMFAYAPKRLIEDWKVADTSLPLPIESGMDHNQIREILDADRQKRVSTLIRELLIQRIGTERAEEATIRMVPRENGIYAIALQLPNQDEYALDLAITPDWSIYQELNDVGSLRRIETIDDLCEAIDRFIGEQGDWGTLIHNHQDELRQLYLYGMRRLSEARNVAGSDFVYHEYLNPDQWVLSLALQGTQRLFPWIADGAGSVDGVSLVPMYTGSGGRVEAIEVYYHGRPSGLRVTEQGLERQYAAALPWLPVRDGHQIRGAAYSMTRGAWRITNEMYAATESLATLRRELALELATRDRMMHPEEIHLQDIPAHITDTLRQALLMELEETNPNMTVDDITIRPVYTRLGLQHIVVLARRNNRTERIVRLSPTGDIQWGWGMLANVNRFADAVTDMRRGVADRIAMGGQRLAVDLTHDHRIAVETIVSDIQVRLDGSIYILHSGDNEGRHVRSNRQLRRFARNARIMQGIATQQDIRADRREEGLVDSAIYTTAALAGAMVSAGLRNSGIYEQIMLATCSIAGALVPAGISAEMSFRTLPDSMIRGTKIYKKRRALRRLTGAGTAFLAGLFGESFLHAVFGTDQQVEKTPQSIKPKAPVDQPKLIEQPVTEKSATIIYSHPSSTPQQEYLLTPTQPVLDWASNPTNEEMKTFFNQLYANNTLESLPEWKQNQLQGWASEILNHNGWRSPTDVEMSLLKDIASSPTYEHFYENVRPHLKEYIQSIQYTQAVTAQK